MIQQERRLLAGGLDADTAYQNIEKDALLNAVNVRTVVSKTQDSTNIKFLAGSTEMENFWEALVYTAYHPHTNVSPYLNGLQPRFVEKGRCVDGTDIYYFLQDYNQVPNQAPFIFGGINTPIPHESRIVKYDTLAKKATIILSEYWTTANLTAEWGTLADNFLDCGVSDGKLFWCDREPRYIDLSINYYTEYTNALNGGELPTYSNGYNPTIPLTTFSADILSLITEPSVVPLTVVDYTDSSVSSLIQFKALQFCVRFTNQSGFYSVLSPYSLTKLPVRNDDIIANGTDYHNIVDIKLDYAQKIPLNWKTIEFIVRDLETNGFYCIKTFDRDNASDVNLVNLHNAGTANLIYSGYYGVNKYAIGADMAAKQFDNVPLTAYSMSLIANRLLLGNILEGYDTPNNGSGFLTITQHTTSVTAPSVISTDNIYIIYSQGAVNAYCFVIRHGGLNYLLPKEYNSVGKYSKLTPITANVLVADKGSVFFNMPKYVSFSSLILLNEGADFTASPIYPSTAGVGYSQFCANILMSALNDGTFVSSDTSINYIYVAKSGLYDSGTQSQQSISVVNNSLATDSGGGNRAFMPNTTYNVGIDFYDSALRKCGNRVYPDKIIVSPETILSGTLLSYVTINVNNTSYFPNWAKYFSITLSKQQKSNKSISFVAPILKMAMKNDMSEFVYGGVEQLFYPIGGYHIYGVAVSLSALNKYGYGYDYKQGDFIELVSKTSVPANTPVLRGNIISVQDGYAIMEYSNTFDTYLSDLMMSSANTQIILDNSTHFGVLNGYAHNANQENLVICTIYEDVADLENYEFGSGFGTCSDGKFFSSGTTTCTVYGDHYTQSRDSSSGGFTCVSYTPNEQLSKFVVNDLGRVALIDRIGQKALPMGIRWSNTFIPSAETNGYASFDALDIKVLDPSATSILRMIPTTKGVTEGSQMLIICTDGSFVSLVGKSQLFGADQQQAAISATNDVIGEVNPLTGFWTCNSPKSVVTYQGLTFWADSQNRDIIQFGANGATPVSAMAKASRLFRYLFTQYDWGTGAIFKVTSVDNSGGIGVGAILSIQIVNGGFGYRTGVYENYAITGGTTPALVKLTVDENGVISEITVPNTGTGSGYVLNHTYTTPTVDKSYYINLIQGAVNPYTNEYIISFVGADPMPNQELLKTTGVYDPFNAYSPKMGSYIYNWNLNKWVSRYENYSWFQNVGDDVYSMSYSPINGLGYDQWTNKLYREFNGTAGNYANNSTHNAMICIPFNGDYPTVKAPLSINGDMSRPPDEVWIEAEGMRKLNSSTVGVAGVKKWYLREGDVVADVLRDRRSLGDDDTKYNSAGIRGNRLKGKTINVCLIWYGGASPDFTCSSVNLKSEVATGHN